MVVVVVVGVEGVRRRLLKYSELSLSTLSINYQNMCERLARMRAPCSGCHCFSACVNFLFQALFIQGKLSEQHVLFQQQQSVRDRLRDSTSLTPTGGFAGTIRGCSQLNIKLWQEKSMWS